MKKFLSIFAVAGLVAITGCSSDDDTVVDGGETVVPAPVTDPAPPMTMDTMSMDTMAPGMTGMTGGTGQ
jgi:hypothetical protein